MQSTPHALVEYAIPLSVQSQIAQNQRVLARTQAYSEKLEANATFAAMLQSQSPVGARQIWIESSGYLTLHIYFKVSGFTVEAAPRLAHLLEYASDFYDEPPSSHDLANTGSRDYFFSPADQESSITLHISAELEENAENCQRIVVGTERRSSYQYVEIDEPVYAFKC